MRIYVIYHKADLDGIVSAGLVFNNLLNLSIPKENFFGMDYKDDWKILINKLNTSDKDNCIILVDVSAGNIENMIELKKVASKLIYIDHHIPAIENYKSLFNRIIDYKSISYNLEKYINDEYDGILISNTDGRHSAVYMTNMLVNRKNNIPIQLLSDYDTWQHNDDKSTIYFQYGARYYIKNFTSHYIKQFPDINSFNDKLVKKFIRTGKILYKNYLYNKQFITERIFDCEFDIDKLKMIKNLDFDKFYNQIKNKKMCAINTHIKSSTLFDYKINIYDICIVFYYDNNKWNYSFYSNKDNVNCGNIATLLGGGGHAGAAGTIMNEFILK